MKKNSVLISAKLYVFFPKKGCAWDSVNKDLEILTRFKRNAMGNIKMSNNAIYGLPFHFDCQAFKQSPSNISIVMEILNVTHVNGKKNSISLLYILGLRT